MQEKKSKLHIGQIIQHKLFNYTGVIFDIDPNFKGTEEWYEQVAKSSPPKESPWYHVLVDEALHTTYVAEQNLEPAKNPQKVLHPLADALFQEFDGKCYKLRQKIH
tara:strand:- start:935 stop:1252 length:318 start_codon:yes stop_codon:yes gene_type:complete